MAGTRATYRSRNPQFATIETDPDVWGPRAACHGRTDLVWFDPADDDSDLDLDRLDDAARDALDALNARVGTAQSTVRSPILALFGDDMDSEEDRLLARNEVPSGQFDPVACQSVCRLCPVRTNCLEWALEWNFTDGFFGGFTPEQREHLRRERELPAHGTRTGYSTHGCSCALCVDANRVWAADRRAPIAAAS